MKWNAKWKPACGAAETTYVGVGLELGVRKGEINGLSEMHHMESFKVIMDEERNGFKSH